jgi:hypothetical protein
LFIIIILLFFLGIGFYALISASSSTITIISDVWELLSPMARIDYYNNDMNSLFKIYTYKMVVTAILYLSIAATGLLAIFFSYQLVFEIDGSWRPELRSKIADETAKRFIDYYKKNESNTKYINEQPKPVLKQAPVISVIPEMKRENNENKNLLIKSNTNKDIEIVDNNRAREEYGSNVPLNIIQEDKEHYIAPNEQEEPENKRKRILRKLNK